MKKWGIEPRKLGNPIFIEPKERQSVIDNLNIEIKQLRKQLDRMQRQIHHLQMGERP
jgi:hypothetical protein